MKKLSLAATTAVSAMLALGPGYALSFDFSSTDTIGGVACGGLFAWERRRKQTA